MKILAVFDDAHALSRLDELKRCGHSVYSVSNPNVVPLELKNNSYDLILCETNLDNRTTAFDLLKMVKVTDVNLHIPFVCVSGVKSRFDNTMRVQIASVLRLLGAQGYVDYETYHSAGILTEIQHFTVTSAQ